jgi:pimeloyl-ACP methyl ester carboxylesterase
MGDALTGAAWRHAPVSGRKLDRVVEGFSGYTVIAIDDACAPALRLLAETSFDRGANAAGSGRQLAAIQSAGSRLSDLRRIKASTLVIHGKADLLVRPSGGRATARAIPNARLQLIDGMGHDLPRGAWPQILDGIVRNAATGSTLVAASSGSS